MIAAVALSAPIMWSPAGRFVIVHEKVGPIVRLAGPWVLISFTVACRRPDRRAVGRQAGAINITLLLASIRRAAPLVALRWSL
jgi:hypothetical protein